MTTDDQLRETAQLEAIAEAMHAAINPNDPWPLLDEVERGEYLAMARAGADVAELLSAPAVARVRSVIETKVWAATLAGLLAAALPIGYDALNDYVTAWPAAPAWAAPVLVVVGTFVAGFRAKHTPRPDLAAQ